MQGHETWKHKSFLSLPKGRPLHKANSLVLVLHTENALRYFNSSTSWSVLPVHGACSLQAICNKSPAWQRSMLHANTAAPGMVYRSHMAVHVCAYLPPNLASGCHQVQLALVLLSIIHKFLTTLEHMAVHICPTQPCLLELPGPSCPRSPQHHSQLS